MLRRDFLKLFAASLATSAQAARWKSGKPFKDDFKFLESTIPQFQRAMRDRKLTSFELTRAYIRRIKALDHGGPNVNSVIIVNPDALDIARDLDRERKSGNLRGSLHGIPVLLKDNIDTGDKMPTTAGSLALKNTRAPRDAFLVEKLREAGAVILGKTNLSEWANFRSTRSTSGWSAVGGLTRNPYALDRNTSGSSSGSAAAVCANFCAVAVGTETDGSIISPSSYCGIVGLKPTVGLISRSGIVPISKSQDTAGPMTRTVADAAILLGAMTGIDPRDEITGESDGKSHRDYTQFLDPNGLRGARLGIARQYFRHRNEQVSEQIEAAVKLLKEASADLVDVELPSFNKIGDAEYTVMLYEFKDGLAKYLATRGDNFPFKNLADIIAFNEAHEAEELRHFGQEHFLRAQEKGPLTDEAYLERLEKCRRLSRAEGIDALMDEHNLDAIVAPSGGPAHRTDLLYGNRDTGGSSSPAAISGYPSIAVPAGFVTGLPLGLSFFGRAWSEPTLLKIAHSFEHHSRSRKPPRFLVSAMEPETRMEET